MDKKTLPVELCRRVLSFSQPLDGAVRAGAASHCWNSALATQSLWSEWHRRWWGAVRPVEEESTDESSGDEGEEAARGAAHSAAGTNWRDLFVAMLREEQRDYLHLREQLRYTVEERVQRWRLRVRVLPSNCQPGEEYSPRVDDDSDAHAWREHELFVPHHVAHCPQSITLCSANAALQDLVFDGSGERDGEGDNIAVEAWVDVGAIEICVFRCARYIMRDPRIVGAGHQRNILQAHLCSMYVWRDQTCEFRKQRWGGRCVVAGRSTSYALLRRGGRRDVQAHADAAPTWLPSAPPPVVLQINVTASTFLRAVCCGVTPSPARSPGVAPTGLLRRMFAPVPIGRADPQGDLVLADVRAEAAAAGCALVGATARELGRSARALRLLLGSREHALSLSLSFVALTGAEVATLSATAFGVPTLSVRLKPTPVALDEGRHACFDEGGAASQPIPLAELGAAAGDHSTGGGGGGGVTARTQPRVVVEFELDGWSGVPDVARGKPCVADFTLFRGGHVVAADCGLEVWRDVFFYLPLHFTRILLTV